MVQKRKLFERGQGVVEYVLITALVALASITIFRAFRADLEKAYRKAGSALVQGVDESLPDPSGTDEP